MLVQEIRCIGGYKEETREAGTIQRVRLRGRQEIINGIS